jgi:hypothetical protein
VVHLQERHESDMEREDVDEVDIQSSDQASGESDSSVSVVPTYHFSEREFKKLHAHHHHYGGTRRCVQWLQTTCRLRTGRVASSSPECGNQI